MQSIIFIFAATLTCTYALMPSEPSYAARYPEYFKYAKVIRHARDLTLEGHADKVLRALGGIDDSLYGKGGYNNFNDHRGRREGQAYSKPGSRVLNPSGDKTTIGGKLDWSNDNARLGSNLYQEGKGGYKQDIFNDHRGRLEGQAYGSRVLSPYGDSTVMGGKLDWSNDNARLGADLHREIAGRSGLTVTGEGVWKLDKNTRFVTGGNLHKTFGHDRPEFGVQGKIEHDF